jgi:hypothetical protein
MHGAGVVVREITLAEAASLERAHRHRDCRNAADRFVIDRRSE